MNNPSFTCLPFESGKLYEENKIVVYGYDSGTFILEEGTYFVFVTKGVIWFNDIPLKAGMYACLNVGILRTDFGSRAILIQDKRYYGMKMFGGPLEMQGRLRYIDGCTDSLLIPPVRKGDPCLNHLHFPAGIDQTMHTHPSVRIGYVYRGQGECITPWEKIPLFPGMVFIIHPENGEMHKGHPVGSHCFRTIRHKMDVVAFHPNSDFGPTDEDHPMIMQTLVDGVSASKIKEIQTRYA
jgi:hypothetical protein